MVIESWPKATWLKLNAGEGKWWKTLLTDWLILIIIFLITLIIIVIISLRVVYEDSVCSHCELSKYWSGHTRARLHSLTFLPLHCRYAGHLTIKMFYKYLLSDTHPPLLNCRPVGQMSIWHVLCFTVLILSRELRPAYWSNSLPSEQQTLLHWPHTMPSQHLNINASIPGH